MYAIYKSDTILDYVLTITVINGASALLCCHFPLLIVYFNCMLLFIGNGVNLFFDDIRVNLTAT